MRTLTTLVMFVPVLLAGCVTSHPQNAEEFRVAVPGAFMAMTEAWEVDRSLKDIAATFQKRAPECLNVKVEATSSSSTSYQVIVTAYKPTVLVTDQRAELHVQQLHEKGVLNVTEVPDGGYFLLVVDAYPLDSNRSKLELFGPSRGYDVLIRAVKGWASGENLGCPDMTKIG
jgi:hypothetical protein